MRYKVTLAEVSKIIETEGLKTPMNVKNQACKEGLFDWGDYQRLRVRRLQ